MFRNDEQACRALGALLHAIPGTSGMWTGQGPTATAVELMRADGGPLASGERVLLLAAFGLWNGEGGLKFADILERLDVGPCERLCSLIVAVKRGALAVDAWIAAQPVQLRPVH